MNKKRVKGTVHGHNIFDLWFFHVSVSPRALVGGLQAFWIFYDRVVDISVLTFMTGVDEISIYILITSVLDTGDKLLNLNFFKYS